MRHHSAFDDALEDLRISGSVLLHEAYPTGWAIDVPVECELRSLMKVSRHFRVLPFHLVLQGGMDLSIDAGAQMRLDAPELSMLPSGAAHRLSFGRYSAVVPFRDILAGVGPQPSEPGTPQTTELVCGIFVVRAAPLNPLLGAMPPAFKVCAGGLNASTTLTGVTSMLAGEIGRRSFDSFTAQRLLEVLFAEALRAHQRDTDARAPGWFTGLADPKIAEALRSIHATAHESISVAGLAAGVALSPSRFAARFKETMGETVMEYAGRWRANLACRLLAETDESLSVIAGKTGFGSLAAFSKAFKAKLGSAPATWRAMYRAQQVQAGSI